MEEQIDRLVLADTWDGSQVFEFAHFTDSEIATAIERLRRKHGGLGLSVTAAMISAFRPRKNLAKLWREWPHQPSKTELADVLWPVLRRRLARKREQGSLDDVPIARVLLRALEIAVRVTGARAIANEPSTSARPDRVPSA
jgi:hypothetical protein